MDESRKYAGKENQWIRGDAIGMSVNCGRGAAAKSFFVVALVNLMRSLNAVHILYHGHDN